VLNALRIQVNGHFREVDEQLSLLDLIASLNLRSERLAIELNGDVVRQTTWGTTVLHPDDKVEIVHFVGGG
jgi:thiamine biosynthesis protein ThiS